MDESGGFSKLQEADLAEHISAEVAKRPPGRPLGARNKIARDVKELIITRGRPAEFLIQVCRGLKIRVADPDKPGRACFVYPSLTNRTEAARVLLSKIVADLKAVEMSADPEAPLFPATDQVSNRQFSRAILAALGSGVLPGNGSPTGPLVTDQLDGSDSAPAIRFANGTDSEATGTLAGANAEPEPTQPPQVGDRVWLEGSTAASLYYRETTPDGREKWEIHDGERHAMGWFFSRQLAEAKAKQWLQEGKLK